MEVKTLYSNASVSLTAVAVLPVELTASASTSANSANDSSCAPTRDVNRAAWQDAALFLDAGEALRTLLFIGDASGLLRSLRLTIERPLADGATGSSASHLCTVEGHRTVMLAACPASPAAAAGSSDTTATSTTAPAPAAATALPTAITFLSVSPYPPFIVVAVAGGTLTALSALNFDVTKDAYWRDCAAVKSSVVRLACEAMNQDGASARQEHCVGVVTAENLVVLLAFGASGVARRGSFVPPDAARSIAWVRSLIVVGGNNGVLYSYDAQTRQLRHQIHTTPSVIGVLPANPALAQLPLLHYLAPTANARSSDAIADAATEGHPSCLWGPALVVSHCARGGSPSQRVLCYAEAPGLGTSSGAGSSVDVVRRALSDPSHELPCPSSVVDLTCLSPFLIGHTKAGLVLQSAWDGEVWLTGPQNSTTFEAKEVRRVVPMPMGALVLSPHTVEAHVLLPFSAQLERLMASKFYRKAEWFFKTCAPPHSGSGAAPSGNSNAILTCEQLYQALAVHAWEQQEYTTAFAYFAKAETPINTLLALFPELHCPSSSSSSLEPATTEEQDARTGLSPSQPSRTTSATGTVRTSRFTTCPSTQPYEALYQVLKAALVAWPESDSSSDGADDDLRRRVEYAVFVLLAVLPHERAATLSAPVPLAEAAAILLQCTTLSLPWCLPLIDTTSTATPFPAPHLVPFLHAACGATSKALESCRATAAVASAGWILRSTTTETDALYMTHLPWMLATDATQTAAILASPHVCAPAVSTVVTVVTGSACDRDVLLSYLHHCVYDGPTTAEVAVQTAYALHLIDLVEQMQNALGLETLGTTPAGLDVPAGAEAGFLGVCRRLLLAFLNDDGAQYDETVILARLHACELFTEKARVQSHMGDHVGTLETLVYDLDDLDSAIRYCLERADEWDTDAAAANALRRVDHNAVEASPTEDTRDGSPRMADSEVNASEPSYGGPSPVGSNAVDALPQQPLASHTNVLLLTLLQLLLTPPTESASPRMSDALHVLATHARFLNPLAVLDILPGEMPLSDIEPYLVRSFQRLELEGELVQVEAAAAASAMELARRLHVRLEQRCAWVTEARQCPVCRQPLSESTAQWVFPDLKVTHFHCAKTQRVDPERQTPFQHH